MKPAESLCSALERWAEKGRGAMLDPELKEHAALCASCGPLLAEIELTRRLVEQLRAPEIPPDRLDGIRFELVAATRREAPHAAAASRPSRPSRRRVAAAAFALFALATLSALVARFLLPRAPARESASNEAPAVVLPAPSGRAILTSGAPDYEYVALEGSVVFDVHPLAPGRHFRVSAGADFVEVRGTRFTVVVRDGRFERVSVDHGVVELHAAGIESKTLRAGDVWQRRALELRGAAAEDDRATSRSARDLQSSAGLPNDRIAASGGVAPVNQRAPDARGSATIAAERARAAPSSAPSSAAADFDRRFAAALSAFNGGRAAEAAESFDALGRDPAVDAGRRSDALYWAARAHEQAGHADQSATRAAALLDESPSSWNADDAALLAAKNSLAQGQTARARVFLNRAARSTRPAVREEASKLLQAIGPE